MSLLDALIDHIARGGEVRVIVLDRGPCEHPMNSPLTSYGKGCRCDRCRDTRSEAGKYWKSTYQRYRTHR